MTMGQRYLAAVAGFEGKDIPEQIRRTFEAQEAFGREWEAKMQAVADNKKDLQNKKE